ncbi:hypothetical protein FRX31_003497 [Thalictrum thalictroides]|uniref:Uncharacterized protein n=1 Tax=Thalictrum thalictroides TaxID=46969 RepID=A0A7J6XEX7_THATH|nr:hypothetical protein FRX31_003497 [Thalictrum thalictroides]
MIAYNTFDGQHSSSHSLKQSQWKQKKHCLKTALTDQIAKRGRDFPEIVEGLLFVAEAAFRSFGKTHAEEFVACYEKCFIFCNAPFAHPRICSGMCLTKCAMTSNTHSAFNIHNICSLGCAANDCTNISTLQNPRRGNEVVRCMNSCAGICNKRS